MRGVPADAGLRVLVADDHPAVRAALRDDIERGGLRVVAEAADGIEAVERALETRPGRLPARREHARAVGTGRGGDDRASRCPRRASSCVSTDLTPENVLDALRAGAAGFLSKDVDPRRLPVVLAAVAAGESAFPRRELRQALQLLALQAA